jgi:cobalt/nickel transport system permease protein
LVFCVVDTLAARLTTLALALAIAAVPAALAGITPRATLRRLAPLNLFMLLVVMIVPLGTGGTPLVTVGGLEYSQEGLRLAGAVVLKGNAIVLAILALVGTMDVIVLGHALHHLGVPEKLIHVMLFSVRYFDVLRREYHRLAGAMKVRAFRPRMDRHTYRTYGYLVGMLLVRSLERSERIVAAMKCRGFRGRFYLLEHFAFSRRDAWFAVAAAALGTVLAWAEFA